MQRLAFWLAGGAGMGIVVSLCIWYMATFYLHSLMKGNPLPGNRPSIDQNVIAAVVETGINNPDVQEILKKQVTIYLKSPEGRQKMAEIMRSPEMIQVFSENVHSPEMQSAILRLMEVPEFRKAVINIIKDTPEMRVLTLISSAIVLDTPSDLPPAVLTSGSNE